jgi:hypothetical protein
LYGAAGVAPRALRELYAMVNMNIIAASWLKVCILCRKRESFILGAQIVTKHTPAVLVLVTIDTEIFPVGTIRRIISVVAVFVMNSQEMAVLVFKLPSAFGTDKAMNLKRLLSVIT